MRLGSMCTNMNDEFEPTSLPIYAAYRIAQRKCKRLRSGEKRCCGRSPIIGKLLSKVRKFQYVVETKIRRTLIQYVLNDREGQKN